MAILFVFVILLVFVFLLFRVLILRRRLLLYLKSNYSSSYKKIVSNYSTKDILMGNPDVVKTLLKQEKKLFHNEMCFDNAIYSMQIKLKRSIRLGLVTAIIWVIYVLFGVRFIG